MIRFSIYPDQFGYASGDAYIISDFVNARSLAANTPETDTIATGANFVIITATATTYFRIWGGGTLAVPGDTTDGSAPELVPQAIPSMRAIIGAKTIGSITASTAALTVDATDGLTIGDTVTVKGAGAAGVDLTTTITAVNPATRVVTLTASASTTVSRVDVTEDISKLTVVAPATTVVTLAYYK